MTDNTPRIGVDADGFPLAGMSADHVSVHRRGSVRRFNLDDTELAERIFELRSYDRLTRSQARDLEDYEAALAGRRRGRLEEIAARYEAAPPEERYRFGESVADGMRPRPQATPADSSPAARSRELARHTVDTAHRAGRLPDDAAGAVEAMLTRGDGEASNAARWVNAAGQPAYASAFGKLLGNPQRGHLTWTPEEQEAFRKVEAYRSEVRALGIGSGAAGDFLVPMELDPAIMLTNAGTASPLRTVARVVQTTTLKWSGVTSAGATAEWKAEHAEAADGSPSFGQPVVDLHLYDVFVPFSYELELSAANLQAQLRQVMVDAAAVHTAAAYANGSGAGQPRGFITALAGGASVVAASTAGTLAAADVYDVQNALSPRFQANATWLASLATLNALDQQETANGSKMFPELGSGRLLRHPVAEDSDMATGAGAVLAYGDFKAGFVIADRIGSTVELVPQVFGTNGRPTGQRGLFLYGATGSDVVVPEALRVLNI